jgi:hypothetical protein
LLLRWDANPGRLPCKPSTCDFVLESTALLTDHQALQTCDCCNGSATPAIQRFRSDADADAQIISRSSDTYVSCRR